MDLETRQSFIRALRLILGPVVRYCIRRSISVQEVFESVKLVFVDEARKELEAKRIKVNTSRLSIATGLRRKEVERVWQGETRDSSPGYVTRVIGQWLGNPKYLAANGKPRVLDYRGEESEFAELVKTVCTDVPSGTVLFELNRIGAVEKGAKGVKLLALGYNPKQNPVEMFKLFAKDCGHLLDCVDENLFEGPKPPNLHIRTEFDNISEEDVPEIRKWLYKQGNGFHDKVRKYLSKYDLDINPKKKKGGAKVLLGSFSRAVIAEPKKGLVDD